MNTIGNIWAWVNWNWWKSNIILVIFDEIRLKHASKCWKQLWYRSTLFLSYAAKIFPLNFIYLNSYRFLSMMLGWTKSAKHLFGFGYRVRIRVINSPPRKFQPTLYLTSTYIHSIHKHILKWTYIYTHRVILINDAFH